MQVVISRAFWVLSAPINIVFWQIIENPLVPYYVNKALTGSTLFWGHSSGIPLNYYSRMLSQAE